MDLNSCQTEVTNYIEQALIHKATLRWIKGSAGKADINILKRITDQYANDNNEDRRERASLLNALFATCTQMLGEVNSILEARTH